MLETARAEPPERLAVAAERSRSARRSGLARMRGVAAPAVVALGLLLAWELAALALARHPPVVPTPVAVLTAVWRDRHLYALDTPPTLLAAALGYGIGNGVAIVLGAAIAALPFGRRESMAVMVALYNVPVIAVAPLLEVLLSGQGPEIATAAISVFFITLVATTEGLSAADPLAVDVVRAAGGGPWAAARLIRVRYAIPRICAALAAAVPFALVGAILGEFLGGREVGLGVLLVGALSNLDAARVWGICLVVGLLGALGVACSMRIGRRLAPWGAARIDRPGRAGWSRRIDRPGRDRRSAWCKAARSLARAGLTVAVLLGIWVGAVKLLDLQPYVVRMPWDVWDYLFVGPGAGGHLEQLSSALAVTVGHALEGCAAGLVTGVAVAVAFTRWTALRASLGPVVVVLSAVPHLALVPVLALVLGHGLAVTLTLAGLIALLPTILNVEAGLSSTPAAYRDLMHVHAAGRWRTLWTVELPHALPYVFTSLRIAAPWALLGVLYAEWLATGQGIGAAMVQQAVSGDYDAAWASAVGVTVMAVALYVAVDRLEQRVRRVP